MTALTKDRATPEALGDVQSFPVLAATKCFAGGIAVLDANGWVRPGITATTVKAVGRFEEQVDNTSGANGDLRAKVKKGVFRYANSAGADEVLAPHVGDTCYVVDDQTVAIVATGRSAAGTVEQVDAQGVWVRFS